MLHESFIEENRNQINMFKRLAKLPHNKRIKDYEFKQQFHKKSKLYQNIKNGNIDLGKLVQLKEEWLDVYTKTNGDHTEKKFEADKRVSVKLAQIYVPDFAKKATYENMSKANRKLRRQLPMVNQPMEMKVGTKGEEPVLISESKTVKLNNQNTEE